MNHKFEDRPSGNTYTKMFNKILGKSDCYDGEIPESFENNGVRYSTAAVQGMVKYKISTMDVDGLIRKNVGENRVFCQDGICIICKNDHGSHRQM